MIYSGAFSEEHYPEFAPIGVVVEVVCHFDVDEILLLVAAVKILRYLLRLDLSFGYFCVMYVLQVCTKLVLCIFLSEFCGVLMSCQQHI